jgi:membrane peptidoglycan carboxypeptidase
MAQRLFQLRDNQRTRRPTPQYSYSTPRVNQNSNGRRESTGGAADEAAEAMYGTHANVVRERAVSFVRSQIESLIRVAKKIRSRTKLVLLGSLVVLILLLVVVAPAYRRVGGELAKRLTEVRATTSSGPYVLTVGDKRPVGELVGYLQATGYSEAASSEDRRRGLYRVLSSMRIVEIYPGGDETIKRDSVKVAYDADGSTIKSITLIATGENVVRWEIKPLDLATYQVERSPDGKVALTAFSYANLDDLRASKLAQSVEDIEDRRFRFRWLPVDFRSAARAFVVDLRAREIKEGGSTLYQQLAKQLFIAETEKTERSWDRKLKELYYSFLIWPQLSKDEVRELYLNTVPTGASADGIQLRGLGASARACYGKHPANLSPSEVAVLTSLIESARYSPLLKSDKATAARVTRVHDVGRKLLEDGLFSKLELDDVVNREPEVRPLLWPDGMGDFLSVVRQELDGISAKVDLPQTPLRVVTSIDPVLQIAVRKSVEKNLPELRSKTGIRDLEAAVVVLDAATGGWLAITGGGNGDLGSPARYNLAFQAARQTGSAFKPFVYTVAFETGLTPSTNQLLTPAKMMLDAPATFKYNEGTQEYSPRNYGDHYQMRPLSLFDALAASSNVITVATTLKVGTAAVASKATAAGLPKPDRTYPSIALGTTDATLAQMVRAYTIFVRGGRLVNPHAISSITTNDGAVTYAPKAEEAQVTDPRVAYMVFRALTGVFERPLGTAHKAVENDGLKGYTIFGKTGTSRDSWFIGGTSRIICAVWVGRRSFKQSKLTGATAALKIWVDALATARRARPELFEGTLSAPPGIVEVPIDPLTGKIASGSCPESVVYPFIKGTEPTQYCEHSQHRADQR